MEAAKVRPIPFYDSVVLIAVTAEPQKRISVSTDAPLPALSLCSRSWPACAYPHADRGFRDKVAYEMPPYVGSGFIPDLEKLSLQSPKRGPTVL